MSDIRPEMLPRDQLQARQLALLQRLIGRICDHNPFWTPRLREAGIVPENIQTLSDLQRLPFLSKQELVNDQNRYPPFGSNLTEPRHRYSRMHQTSGTTGRPLRWLDTPETWDWFLRLWDQIYRLVGVRQDDVFAFPFSFGPFVGFWAAFEGAQRLGNLSLTMGGMSTEARLRMLLDLQATIVCCTPTYALRMCEVAEQLGLDLPGSAVRMLIVAGEPGGAIPSVRQRIEAGWGARLIDHWGMTDVGSLGIEPVEAPGGLLLLESECIAEIIDPETLAPSRTGEPGELVITNLGRVGQPVLRYRTGDLVRASRSPLEGDCSLLWLAGGILGRCDDMVTIRGNNVFPSSLDAILHEFSEIAEYRVTVMTHKSMPHLRIEIEPAGEAGQDSANLLSRVSRAIKDRMNFQAEITTAADLPRFEMKARRFHREPSS